MTDFTKAQIIKQARANFDSNNYPELQKKKEKLLDWLLISQNIQVCEMYQNSGQDVIKSKFQIPQYIHEFFYANTRTQIETEVRAETDKLPFENAVEFICEICEELIKKQIHFCVFYAEGQRSPHIIIYDFQELKELSPFQRLKARAKFWRWLIPFRFHLLDHSLFDDSHLVPLEFSLHWKYGTPFNLMFEWVPEIKEGKPNAILT